MSEKTELSIGECIAKLAGKGKVQTLGALVKSVDPDKGLCTVEIEILELEFDDIRLTAFETDDVSKCLLVLPKVGSYILIGRIEGSDNWYVAATTEVDEIRLGGKKYSSVNGETLQDEINTLKKDFNDHITDYNAHTHVLALSAGTGTAAPTTTVGTPSAADFSQILNDKVKHGE